MFCLSQQCQPPNEFDTKIKCTKDLLQAELCSTLKRRKNVPIVEPPRYQYPRYEDVIDGTPTASSSTSDAKPTAIKQQTDGYDEILKSALGPIKPIPSTLFALNNSGNSSTINNCSNNIVTPAKETESQTVNKAFISHGKPNYTLPRKLDKCNDFELASTHEHTVKNNNYGVGSNVTPTRFASNPIKENSFRSATLPRKLEVINRFEAKSADENPFVFMSKPINKFTTTSNGSSEDIAWNSSPTDRYKSISPMENQYKSTFLPTRPFAAISNDSGKNGNVSAGKKIVKIPAKSFDPFENHFNYTTDKDTPPPLPTKLPPSMKVYNIKRDETKNTEQDGKKRFISHGKPNFVVPQKSTVIIKPSSNTSTKQACENYLEVKIKSLKPQKSIDESEKKFTNVYDSAATAFTPINHLGAAKRSLKSSKSMENIADDPICNNEHNEIRRALTKLRCVDDMDSNPLPQTQNWSGRSTPASELSADSGNSSPPASAFGRPSANNSNNAYTNYEQKTVVSFSKDLLDAPNRYPESIKVTKTITSSSSHHSTSVVQQTFFNNVKFIIDDNGQVVHTNY